MDSYTNASNNFYSEMTKKINFYFTLFCLVLFTEFVSAQKFNDFNFFREINEVSASSYYKIKLDNEILGKSNYEFNDFRIFRVDENDTIETPYLLNWDKAEYEYIKQYESIIDKSYKANNTSYYTIKIKERREINEINLEVSESNFDKTLKLEGSDDNKNWKTIKENIRIVGFQQNDFKYTKINFNVSSFPYYRVSINDQHSNKINIEQAYTAYNRNVVRKPNYIKDTYIVRKEIKKTEKPKPTESFVAEAYTQIKVTLPYKASINSLSLSCREKNLDFYRQIAIYDKKGKELYYGNFTNLCENGINNYEFAETNLSELLIKIFNKDNEALPGIDIKVNGSEAYLLGKLEPEEKYLLAYSGRKNIAQGNYDLHYFSDKMERTSKAIDLKSEQVIKHEKPKKKESIISDQKWLWITLIGLVLLLGAFAFSLMKKVNR